jgi:coenzyme Q-binding protein COQ10
MGVQSHIEQKHLPFSAAQMFTLVAEVDKYQDFAPWCMASRITKRESQDIFFADLVVGYRLMRERFTSKVHLEHPDHIYIEYLRGPLKHLKNHWRFIPQDDGSCIIDFSVEFEFKNGVLQRLAEMFFNEVIRRMVEAFEKRAHQVYEPIK